MKVIFRFLSIMLLLAILTSCSGLKESSSNIDSGQSGQSNNITTSDDLQSSSNPGKSSVSSAKTSSKKASDSSGKKNSTAQTSSEEEPWYRDYYGDYSSSSDISSSPSTSSGSSNSSTSNPGGSTNSNTTSNIPSTSSSKPSSGSSSSSSQPVPGKEFQPPEMPYVYDGYNYGNARYYLPIIVIDTKGKHINEYRNVVNATMRVYDRNTNSIGDTPTLTTAIQIHVRGQSSSTFPKKHYKIHTVDASGNNNNISIFGLPAENDFALNGNYTDKTLIRNYVSYEIFRPVAKYTPRVRFCEVYLVEDGGPVKKSDYQGIFTFIETIKIDKNRVDIEKLSPDIISGNDLTGGYIVAMDKVKAHDLQFNINVPGRTLTFTYESPSKNVINSFQQGYIRNYINTFLDVLFSDFYKNAYNGYRKYIDVDSFATHIAIQEFIKNVDGFHISTYFYKPRGDKLYAGPPWDFDISGGNADYNYCDDYRGWYNTSTNEIPRRLMKDEYFADVFRIKMKQLRNSVLSNDNINRLINQGLTLINDSQKRNAQRWPELWSGKYIWPNPNPQTRNHRDDVERYRSFLLNRANWIDQNIDKPINLRPWWERANSVE